MCKRMGSGQMWPEDTNLRIKLRDLVWRNKLEHHWHEDYVWICCTEWNHTGRRGTWIWRSTEIATKNCLPKLATAMQSNIPKFLFNNSGKFSQKVRSFDRALVIFHCIFIPLIFAHLKGYFICIILLLILLWHSGRYK